MNIEFYLSPSIITDSKKECVDKSKSKKVDYYCFCGLPPYRIFVDDSFSESLMDTLRRGEGRSRVAKVLAYFINRDDHTNVDSDNHSATDHAIKHESIFDIRHLLGGCLDIIDKHQECLTDGEKQRLKKIADDKERKLKYNRFMLLLDLSIKEIDLGCIVDDILDNPNTADYYVNLLLAQDAFLCPELASYSHMYRIFGNDFPWSDSTWNGKIKPAKDKAIERNKNKKAKVVTQAS